MASISKVDFFISYNHNDEGWAVWLAWLLEAAGYVTIVQAWDFQAGGNFILEMQDATARAERTIAVLSPDYLGSEFVKPEWAAAFAQDPSGVQRLVVPIRVVKCEVPGMLGQINYVDVVGLDEASARHKVLAALQPGRAKPTEPPPFPGPAPAELARPAPVFPAEPTDGAGWQVVKQAPAFDWRDSVLPRLRLSRAAFEVHLVPVNPQRIEVRRLGSLADQLMTAGRQSGLFEPAEAIERIADDQCASAYVDRRQTGASSGLVVTRAGQRGAWFPLPSDMMGSIYDRADVVPRLTAVIDLLLALRVPKPELIAVSARIEPISSVQVGQASAVGRRNTAQMLFAFRGIEPVLPEDALNPDSIGRDVAGFVEEVIARLEAKLGVGRP
jgi:hypothetical protein